MRLAALTLLLTASSAAADPFTVRDQNPLLAGFGLPGAMPARMADAGAWSIGVDLYWSSTALLQQRGSEFLIVDAETRETRLTLQGSVTDRIAWQLQLPYRYTGAGNLDGFIDSWHDAFGLPDGARSQLPQDEFDLWYSRSGSSSLDVTSSVSGLADVQAAVGYEMIASPVTAVTAWLSIKLPTGDEDKLTGSGATDVSLLLAGQHRFGTRWSLFGQASVTWLGNGGFVAAEQRSVVWGGLAGLSWQVWRGLSLKAQIDAHSAAFDSALDFLNEAVVLTVGGDYRFASGWRFDLGVSEDLAVEHSPDVVFVTGLKRSW